MKILFIADLHIKIGQKSVPRDWARRRYQIMFKEFARVKREFDIDLEIHGGDIFDKLPNLEELSIYLNYVASAGHLVVFDGNHEATKKGETFLTLIKDVLSGANPNCTLIDDYHSATDALPFDIIPYNRLKDFEKNGNSALNSQILLTHVRGEIPPHVLPEVDLNIFNKWKVVLAGDLHSHSNCQRNILYPGSPVTVSFHRKEVDTGVIVFDTDTLEWEWVRLEVPQLIRKTVSKAEDMVDTTYHRTIYELEGDAVDLAGVSSDVLDKKIIKTTEEATLNLANMSDREQMVVFLKEIVGLDEEKLTICMRYYDASIKDA